MGLPRRVELKNKADSGNTFQSLTLNCRMHWLAPEGWRGPSSRTGHQQPAGCRHRHFLRHFGPHPLAQLGRVEGRRHSGQHIDGGGHGQGDAFAHSPLEGLPGLGAGQHLVELLLETGILLLEQGDEEDGLLEDVRLLQFAAFWGKAFLLIQTIGSAPLTSVAFPSAAATP